MTGGSNASWQGEISGGGGGQVIIGAGKSRQTQCSRSRFYDGLFNTAGGTLAGIIVNNGIVTSAGTNATILADQDHFYNQSLFEQTGNRRLGFNGYGGGLTSFINMPEGTFEFALDVNDNLDCHIFQNSCCGSFAFDNEGTVSKRLGAGRAIISVPFNNLGGEINVDSGVLTLAGGGTSSNGSFSVSQGAALDLTGGGSATWAGAMDGYGSILFSNGTIIAELHLALNFPISSFKWRGGVFAGTVSNVNSVHADWTNAASSRQSIHVFSIRVPSPWARLDWPSTNTAGERPRFTTCLLPPT